MINRGEKGAFTKLESALDCAARGLRVHPLHWIEGGKCSCRKDCGRSAGKHPQLKGWIDKATCDETMIRGWWLKTPDANIGIATGEGSDIIVIDQDGPEGAASLVKLDLPRTLTVRTGSHVGSHRYFKHTPGIRNTVQRIAPGIDVRTERGNIAGPGSITTGVYEIVDDSPIAELPVNIVELMRAEPTDEPSDVALPDEHETPREIRERRARGYARTMDPAISGSGGHTAAFVACEKIVRGFELEEAVAYRILADEWNLRCVPPWAPLELRRKVREAKEKGRMTWGQMLRSKVTIPEQPAGDWRASLIKKKDQVSPCLSNVITILRYADAWRGVIANNTFSDRIVYRRSPPWRAAAAPAVASLDYSERDAARVVDWFAHAERLDVPHWTVEQAIGVVAESDQCHPVREYLESLTWDGVERLSGWLTAYAGVERNEYSEMVGSRWLISAVARVMRPGCQVDCTLVLEGVQGTGKSRLFRSLVPSPEFYSETGVNVGEKDSYQALHGVWIYVLDELDSLRRADVTRVKSFLSSPKDHYRPSYGRVARDFLRQNVFGGTTNEQEYLLDRTGNRRFWPARVTVIRIDHIARDRDQLWAEAYHNYLRGDLWYADTPGARRLCERQQYDRVADDPLEVVVSKWLAEPRYRVRGDTLVATGTPLALPGGAPLTIDVCVHAMGIPIERVSQGDHMRAAALLRSLGYERGPYHWEGTAKVRRYVPAQFKNQTKSGQDAPGPVRVQPGTNLSSTNTYRYPLDPLNNDDSIHKGRNVDLNCSRVAREDPGPSGNVGPSEMFGAFFERENITTSEYKSATHRVAPVTHEVNDDDDGYD